MTRCGTAVDRGDGTGLNQTVVAVRVTSDGIRALVSAASQDEYHTNHRAENNECFHFLFGPLTWSGPDPHFPSLS